MEAPHRVQNREARGSVSDAPGFRDASTGSLALGGHTTVRAMPKVLFDKGSGKATVS